MATENTGEQPTTTENQAAAGSQQEKTFTQEEVNKIVSERLARAKAQVPEDYDDLKAKAAKLDQIEQATKTDLEKLQEQVDNLTAESAAKDAQLLKAQIAQETGVPADLLVGANADELRAAAERVNEYAKKQAGYPTDKGGAGGTHKMSKADILAIKDPKARRKAIGDNIDLF